MSFFSSELSKPIDRDDYLYTAPPTDVMPSSGSRVTPVSGETTQNIMPSTYSTELSVLRTAADNILQQIIKLQTSLHHGTNELNESQETIKILREKLGTASKDLEKAQQKERDDSIVIKELQDELRKNKELYMVSLAGFTNSFLADSLSVTHKDATTQTPSANSEKEEGQLHSQAATSTATPVTTLLNAGNSTGSSPEDIFSHSPSSFADVFNIALKYGFSQEQVATGFQLPAEITLPPEPSDLLACAPDLLNQQLKHISDIYFPAQRKDWTVFQEHGINLIWQEACHFEAFISEPVFTRWLLQPQDIAENNLKYLLDPDHNWRGDTKEAVCSWQKSGHNEDHKPILWLEKIVMALRDNPGDKLAQLAGIWVDFSIFKVLEQLVSQTDGPKKPVFNWRQLKAPPSLTVEPADTSTSCLLSKRKPQRLEEKGLSTKKSRLSKI
ncbi:hypothetical protein M3P05_06970 [Sansalvadorimonas sp. 2012CJ34-2]|uniref:Uncharacterized protein n=1 Tax=Parendozoicomonas callyspongiae TaxID=2942213 RepID=A0ABT0PE82_9GAMM|nr:hypothetical protein [Sansalvadorimonas sp. 2012CJ34-2]MCL6269679.1 hypothetical protein [Sansalvadorimonas sp. 2012CJ34-2]